jgi:PAS domain S-box-containing protein
MDGAEPAHTTDGHDPGPDIESDLVGIILSLVPDAAIVVDGAGTIVSANARVVELFGYRPSELVGQPVELLVPERSRGAHADQRGEYVERPRPRSMGAGLELAGRRADGTEFPVDISLAPFRGIGAQLVIAAIRDITEAREARELVLLGEERERIARDLHDLVIQRLFAAGLTLQSVINGVGDERSRSRLNDVIDDLDTTIRDIRTTIFTLSSTGVGSTGGVRDALLGVAREAGHSLGFEPAMRFEGPVDSLVSGDLTNQLVAVAREALSNAARHAQASSVEVELSAGDEVVLVVSDDGTGIGEHGYESGLANLRERAERLGGSFELRGAAGGGTTLVWRVPCT